MIVFSRLFSGSSYPARKENGDMRISVLLLSLMLLSMSFFASHVVAVATPLHFNHIVIIMQENHSFDNMFGTFPNLPAGYGLNLATCIPLSTSQRHITPCDKPWNADSQAATVQGQDISHTRPSALKAYNNGKMNGFIANAPSCCKNTRWHITMALSSHTIGIMRVILLSTI